MKGLLLDQGLAPGAAEALRSLGFDAIHVVEIGMDRADDAAILEFARNHSRICITLDHDFHSHLALTGRGDPSVVLLRVEGLDAAGQSELIRTVYVQSESALLEGAAVSADAKTIRIRRLPLKVTS